MTQEGGGWTLDILPIIPASIEIAVILAILFTLLVVIISVFKSESSGAAPSTTKRISLSGSLIPLGGVILIGVTILVVALYWPSQTPFLALVLPILWHYTASRTKAEAHFWGITWRDGEQYLSSYLMLQFMFQMLFLVGVILLLLLWGPWFLAKALQGSALYIILGVGIIFTTWFFESWGKFTRMMLYAFGGGVTLLWLFGRNLAAQNDFATIELWRNNILELDKLFYL